MLQLGLCSCFAKAKSKLCLDSWTGNVQLVKTGSVTADSQKQHTFPTPLTPINDTTYGLFSFFACSISRKISNDVFGVRIRRREASIASRTKVDIPKNVTLDETTVFCSISKTCTYFQSYQSSFLINLI